MKKRKMLMIGALGCLAGSGFAGEPVADSGMIEEVPAPKGIFDYLKPTVDIRARYEDVETSGLNDA